MLGNNLQPASIREIKLHLSTMSQSELVDCCLKLARYKLDNKAYLDFMLFESVVPEAFTARLKENIDEAFSIMNKERNLFFTKKSIRKILRTVTRYSRYAGNPSLTCEWILYFCFKLNESGIPFRESPVLMNLFRGQLKKVEKTLLTMHEDFRLDYQRELDALSG